MSKRQDENDVKKEAKAPHSDESGKMTPSQHDLTTPSLTELQHEAVSYVLDRDGKPTTEPSKELSDHARIGTREENNSDTSLQKVNELDAIRRGQHAILEKWTGKQGDHPVTSPLRHSFTEELAMVPPSLESRARLPAVPGAQRIGGRELSLGNSIISEQHEHRSEEIPPRLLSARVVDEESQIAQVSAMTPSTISARAEIMQDPEPAWRVLMANRKCQLGVVLLVFVIIGLTAFVVVDFTDGSSPVPATRTPEIRTQTPSMSWSPTTSPTPLYSFRPFLATVLSKSSLDALDRNESPQQRALLWVNSDTRNLTDAQRLQRWTLHVIYGSTRGSSWNSNKGWLTETAECSWEHVTCEGENVMALSLAQNALEGRISEELALLTLLKSLDLGHNILFGSLPTALGGLANLMQFRLHNNSLSGTFSSVLMNLKNLTTFHASYNYFSGSLPSLIGELTNLVSLKLSDNQLKGTLPETLGDMTHLAELELSANSFTGPLPNQLTQLNNLSIFHASVNNLTMALPVDLGLWSSMQSLDLRKNFLTGIISSQIGMLTMLSSIDFSVNDMEGTLPSELGLLTALELLYLETNYFSGSIPSQLGQLTGLTHLFMLDNDLTGSIPSELGLLTNLKLFLLSNTFVTGTVPATLCEIGANVTIDCCFVKECTCCVCDYPVTECGSSSVPTPTITGTFNQSPSMANSQTPNASQSPSVKLSNASPMTAPIAIPPVISNSPTFASQFPLNYSFRPFLSTVLSNSSMDALDRTDSPQQQALAWINSDIRDLTEAHRLQRWVLYVFYASTHGIVWTNSLGWLTESTECLWEYVKCGAESLMELSLVENALEGQIPEELSFLTSLQALNLANNSLGGTVPFGGWSLLQSLQLSSNSLSGSMSSQIGRLTSLEFVDIGDNLFQGSLPLELGNLSRLQYLIVYGNGFDGEIPTELGLLTALEFLYLESNFLSGSIPSQLGQLTGLIDLAIGDNDLTGSIPSELGLLTNLQLLSLWNTTVTGTVPAKLCEIGANVEIDCCFVKECSCCVCDYPVTECIL